MKAFVPVLFACFCLTACAHMEPWWGSDVPSQQVAVEEQLHVTPWWQAFQDPLMDRFAQELLAQNLDIRMAEARIAQARGMLRSTEAGWLPDVSLTGTATRGNAFMGATKVASLAQGGFDATWELDIFGTIRAQVSGAEAQLMASEASLEDVKRIMLADVMRAVIEWREAQEIIRETEALLATQDEQVGLFFARVEAGLMDATFLTRARAEQARTATRLPLAHAQAIAAQSRIARLLAKPVQEVDMGTENDNPFVIPPREQTGQVDIGVLRQRPDIRRLRAEMLAAEAGLAEAEANLWPRLSLQAFFGAQDGSEGLPIAGNPIWSIASGITAPILNFGRLRGAVSAADARAQEAALAYEEGVLAALEEMETAFADYIQGMNAVQEHEAALAFRKDTVQLASQRFERGLTDMTGLTTAQAELNQATLELTSQRARTAIAYIRLQKALGAGGGQSASSMDSR